ncbi:rlmJ, partial [Symbiodinium sp. CCMP2456]
MDVCLAAGRWAAAFSFRDALEALGIHAPTPALRAYNHHEQAGSIMDCLKHSLLLLLLQHYAADSQPFTYIDGHAGRGIYDLAENLTEFQNYGLNLLERHHHRLNSDTPWAVASLLE